jgi:hypothetical protein
MTVQESVQLFVAVQSSIIAVSHIVQPHAWVDFFVWLRGKGHAGVFANGFLSLWFGGLIVAFHPVWSGPAIVITLIGWAQVIKSAIAFVVPSLSMRGFQRVSHERSREFVIAGSGLLAISALSWYVVLIS